GRLHLRGGTGGRGGLLPMVGGRRVSGSGSVPGGHRTGGRHGRRCAVSMRAGRARRGSAVLAAAAAALLVAGCSSGSGAGEAEPQERAASAEYVRLLEECDIVSDERIAQIIGADAVRNHFHGAVCRWQVVGADRDSTVT